MRYAFTKDRFVVKVGRIRRDKSADCDIVQWSVKKSRFVLGESRVCYEDELEFIPAGDVKETLAVERREAEAEAEQEKCELFKELGAS